MTARHAEPTTGRDWSNSPWFLRAKWVADHGHRNLGRRWSRQ